MKRIFTYLTGFSLLAITTVSCTKESHNEMRPQAAAAPQVISAIVPAGQSYELNLGRGTTASIQTQALHYQFSQIVAAPDGSTVYKYTAGKGFAGADEVTLKQTITSTSVSNGCNRTYSNSYTSTASKTIVIKFDVAN